MPEGEWLYNWFHITNHFACMLTKTSCHANQKTSILEKKTFKQKKSIYNKINAEVISKTNANLTKKWNIATIFLHWSLMLQWRRFQMTVEMPLLSLKISRQFFNQWEAPSTRDFSRALSELQEIASNSDWFVALFALVVIGRSLITLGLLFRQSLENHSITHETEFCSRITKPTG